MKLQVFPHFDLWDPIQSFMPTCITESWEGGGLQDALPGTGTLLGADLRQ